MTLKTSFSIFSALCLLLAGVAHSEPLGDIPLKSLDGQDTSLAPFKGKVMLIVNVASKCGNTPQYSALEAAYEKHKDDGFVILGFPCNQFGNQEPGAAAEIATFCSATYGVKFPLFEKIDVNGPSRSALYAELAGPASPFPGDIKWNFTKFLIGRDGKILARFEPATRPDSPEVTKAVELALAAK